MIDTAIKQKSLIIRKRLAVSGVVQGVGFRYFTLQAARRCGVRGDVRNLRDGRVEVRVRATPRRIRELREQLRQGPSGAHVESIEAHELDDAPTFRDFEVRF